MKDHEREHIGHTKFYVGCLPCLTNSYPNMASDYHHVAPGRKRLGHLVGFGMCLWHHRGERDWTWSHLPMTEIKERLGPSLARDKRQFRDRYGDELLLVKLNNFALSLWSRDPWMEHLMPNSVMQEIQAEHRRLLLEA